METHKVPEALRAPESTAAMPDLFLGGNAKNESLIPLRKQLEEIQENHRTAPFLAVVQSSGYGKTRLMLDLAKERRVVYLLCSDIRGGWNAPDVVKNFIEKMRNLVTTEQRKKEAARFLRAVSTVAATYETTDALLKAQFDKDGKLHEFYDKLGPAYQAIDESTRTSKKKKNDPVNERAGRLVVVFDEAKKLATNDTDNLSSPYRCIRAMLEACNLIGVLVDTSGQLQTFARATASSDRSPDPTGWIGRFAHPFFEIDSFDLHDNGHSSFLGRPLWKSRWETRSGKDFKKLIEFAAQKLLGEGDADGLLALFLCRFGLDPNFGLAERLVGSHMATLFDMTVDRKKLISGYRSEPILAEASANQTTGRKRAKDMLACVGESLSNGVVESRKGNRGEVAAAAWIGLSLDRVRAQLIKTEQVDVEYENLSCAIPVSEFLKGLGCELNNDHLKALVPWAANCTHFCRPTTSPVRNVLNICWKRHAALYMIDGEEGIDLLIPMKSQDHFSTIRIQVKNYKNKIGESALATMVGKLDVRRCAPQATFKEEPSSVTIVVQVGIGSITPFVKIEDLGRHSRASNPKAQQLQVACAMSGEYLKELRVIAGDPIDNHEFVGASLKFKNKEWMD